MYFIYIICFNNYDLDKILFLMFSEQYLYARFIAHFTKHRREENNESVCEVN